MIEIFLDSFDLSISATTFSNLKPFFINVLIKDVSYKYHYPTTNSRSKVAELDLSNCELRAVMNSIIFQRHLWIPLIH